MKAIAKISAKSIGVNVEMEIGKDAKGKDTPVAKSNEHNKFLFRVLGMASGMKTGVSTYGEWVAFMGQFEATVIETGEVFRAGKLFLPPIASNLLQGAVNGSPVEFGFDVGVTPAPNSATGYEWTVTPILEVSESDPVKLLANKLTANAPALPAPTKPAGTPDPAPAPTPAPAPADAESKASNSKKGSK
jgi:hypothetical protein